MTITEARQWCANQYDQLVPHYPRLADIGKAQYVRANARHVAQLDPEAVARIESARHGL